MDLTLRDLIKMDFINSSELSPVNDDVDLDAIDFQVLPWLTNRGESNNNQNMSERKLNQYDNCNKNSSNNTGIKRHQIIQNGVKPHECEYCNKKFASQSVLVQHRRIHSGEKPFPCEFCEKSFTQSAHLKSHRRIHTGEKPYECELCNKRFTRRNNMLYHRRSHK